MRAEVADALVNRELAVGTQDAQAVDADRSGGIRAGRHADAPDLAAGALAAVGLARFPAEDLRALVERLFHETAGQLVARPAGRRVGRDETEEGVPDRVEQMRKGAG